LSHYDHNISCTRGARVIKLGIYNLEQIKKNTNFKGLFGGDKKISITLYDKILDEPDADRLAERILIYFSDDRGAYKRTYSKRFEEFDSIALDCLKGAFNNNAPLVFQDVAVSDGRTALDLFEQMSVIYPDLSYIASDYSSKVYVLDKGNVSVTISTKGQVLEIIWPPFVFNAMKKDSCLYYPLNCLIQYLAQQFIVPSILKEYDEGALQSKELVLFSHQVLKCSQDDNRFILSQHDLLQSFKEPAHAIRAMNVLNPSYFSDSEFIKILNNIHASLCKGGLFITGSNQDADTTVHGGIYEKTINGFKKIKQCGDGSPIDTLLSSSNYFSAKVSL